MNDIWKNVIKTSICWNWIGEVNDKGYGRIQIEGRRMSAHIFFYELFNGKISNGLELDHICRVRNCVNPKHLEPVTHSENVKRAWAIRIKNTPNCPNGHAYDEKNLYIFSEKKTGKKWRLCRKCRAINQRKYKANHLVELHIIN